MAHPPHLLNRYLVVMADGWGLVLSSDFSEFAVRYNQRG